MRARLAAAPAGFPYRCFLPDLAGFGDRRHSGPGRQPTNINFPRVVNVQRESKGKFICKFQNSRTPWRRCSRTVLSFIRLASSAGGRDLAIFCKAKNGGERGIRTLDTPCGHIRAFQARSLGLSDISPFGKRENPCGIFALRQGKNVVFPRLTASIDNR